jgi:hypothetical protein
VRRAQQLGRQLHATGALVRVSRETIEYSADLANEAAGLGLVEPAEDAGTDHHAADERRSQAAKCSHRVA